MIDREPIFYFFNAIKMAMKTISTGIALIESTSKKLPPAQCMTLKRIPKSRRTNKTTPNMHTNVFNLFML